jgi:hypothetical protein
VHTIPLVEDGPDIAEMYRFKLQHDKTRVHIVRLVLNRMVTHSRQYFS